MIRFKDDIDNREYILCEDSRKALAGYYFAFSPRQTILFCAESGRWFAWNSRQKSWQREQEWCRSYYERKDDFVRILPPEGLPSPDSADAEAEKKLRQKMVRVEEPEQSMGANFNFVLRPDGSCIITDGYSWSVAMNGDYDEEWELDTENARKLLTVLEVETGIPAADLTWSDYRDGLSRLKNGRYLSDLLDDLGIAYWVN